jgi:hypothetical protein
MDASAVRVYDGAPTSRPALQLPSVMDGADVIRCSATTRVPRTAGQVVWAGEARRWWITDARVHPRRRVLRVLRVPRIAHQSQRTEDFEVAMFRPRWSHWAPPVLSVPVSPRVACRNVHLVPTRSRAGEHPPSTQTQHRHRLDVVCGRPHRVARSQNCPAANRRPPAPGRYRPHAVWPAQTLVSEHPPITHGYRRFPRPPRPSEGL